MSLIDILYFCGGQVSSVETDVVDAAGIEAEVRHVTDNAEIASRGVLGTPGLAIDVMPQLFGP